MRLTEIWRKQKLFSLSLAGFALAGGILLGTLVTQGVHAAAQNKAVAPDATPLVTPPAVKLSNQFSDLAKRIEPSVVFIQTEINPKPQAQNMPQQPRRVQPPSDDEDENPGPDLFRRFFGEQMPNTPPHRRQGQGSGFVVDKNGYIMTNFHVVDGADKITVTFPSEKNGEPYKAHVVGFDWESDVAVLKIDAGKPLQPLKVGNSDSVQVGDWAVAIGAPFGLEASVTAGIVSATGRDINTQQFQRFIQTDAAINPGNSGGPLVNINGEVVAINTMIATRTGGYEGIGFALPMNTAVKSYNDIIQYGSPRRGSIGISFNKLTKPDVFKAYGYEGGVIVSDVTKGGPSEKAGLQVDDMIVALNGKPVKDGDELVSRIASLPTGSDVTVTLDRNGKKLDKKVTVLDRNEVFKDDQRFARFRPQMAEPEAAVTTSAKFGIGIQPVPPQFKKTNNIEQPGGVRVTTVEDGSFAEEIGLQVKDIVLTINRVPVSSIEDIRGVQAKIKAGDPVAFKVLRQTPPTRPGADPGWTPLYLAGKMPKGE